MEKFGDYHIMSDENIRSENLEKYQILHTRSEPVFDELAALAATVLDMPVALINFIDGDKIWSNELNLLPAFKVDAALCSMAVVKERIKAMEHLIEKPYLMANPIIAAESGLRFYASVPVTTESGLNVGMVCVADQQARSFPAEDRAKLVYIAGLIQKEMNERITRDFCA